MTHLHTNFLHSSESYEEARNFWSTLLRAPESLRASEWVIPWLTEPVDELRDGNPIVTAWSPTLRRGVRVIHREPKRRIPDLTYWLDVFGGRLYEPDAIEELVLNCAPSQELIPQLESLLSGWMSGGPVSVSVEVPQLLTEARQLVMPAMSQFVGEAA